jgi:HAD hydrolase, family IA, variant 1
MKTAIFDLDGTIADTLNDLADSVNYGLRQLGYPEHCVEKYKRFVGNGAQKLCCRALPDDRKSDAERLHLLFSQYYGEHFLDKTKLYSGIKETVDRLSANGVTLAVATNKPQDVARKVVSALLPDTYFVKVLGGCDERPKKPDAAIIREILSKLPHEDNKVFMIGDSNVDIQTAKNSGLVSIGCIWGFRGREELESEGADYIAETPEDIARIILENKF